VDGSVDILDTSDLLNIKLIQRVKIPELGGLTLVAIHPTYSCQLRRWQACEAAQLTAHSELYKTHQV